MSVIECRNTSLRHIVDSLPLNADAEAENIIDFRDSKCGTIQVIREDGDANDGEFYLKVSLLCDPTTFFKFDGSELPDPDDSCDGPNLGWVFTDIPFRYAQVCYTKGSDTQGTFSVYCMGKK